MIAFDVARRWSAVLDDRTTVLDRELERISVLEEERSDRLCERELEDERFEAEVVLGESLTSRDGHSMIFAHVLSPTSYSTRNLPSGLQSVTTACSHFLCERLKTSTVSPTCGPGGHVDDILSKSWERVQCLRGRATVKQGRESLKA
mmetsp:Transcript_13531/g.24109  ORF Transcript_13531/g.24109 Transcript_13531/m.24109 type:complete len:147 (-) Transcript_13531:16-456(-)